MKTSSQSINSKKLKLRNFFSRPKRTWRFWSGKNRLLYFFWVTDTPQIYISDKERRCFHKHRKSWSKQSYLISCKTWVPIRYWAASLINLKFSLDILEVSYPSFNLQHSTNTPKDPQLDHIKCFKLYNIPWSSQFFQQETL